MKLVFFGLMLALPQFFGAVAEARISPTLEYPLLMSFKQQKVEETCSGALCPSEIPALPQGGWCGKSYCVAAVDLGAPANPARSDDERAVIVPKKKCVTVGDMVQAFLALQVQLAGDTPGTALAPLALSAEEKYRYQQCVTIRVEPGD